MTSPAVGSDLAVSLRHICKGYPGVQALDAVSLDVRFGEVHAIVGENGAGKSTLLKILSGLVEPDCGTVQVSGTILKPHTTIAARRLGVRVVPQDVLVVQGLIAGRNVTLGQERWNAHRGRLSGPERAAVGEAMTLAGLASPATVRSGRMSVPEQRLLQIAAGLYGSGKVLVLDEPTAVVSEADSEHLLQRLNALREQGMAILYVSHRLTEVLTIADRVTVLRDGRKVAENPRAEVTREGLIRHMTKVSASSTPTADGTAAPGGDAPASGSGSGRPHALTQASGSEVRVEALHAPPSVVQASLTLRPGRVAGIVGVQGSGHGDLLHALAGLRDYDGTVDVAGRRLAPGSVASARRAGVRLVPGDRRRAAIAAHLSLADNVALSSATSSRFGFRRRRTERASAAGYVATMDVRPPSTGAKAGSLSGGNQQKIAIANALESQPRVLLLEEPTQGVDVMGKVEIRKLIRALARSGRCVAIATSEFEDLPDYVDDIYVMRLGRLHGPVPPEQATYERLLHAALP